MQLPARGPGTPRSERGACRALLLTEPDGSTGRDRWTSPRGCSPQGCSMPGEGGAGGLSLYVEPRCSWVKADVRDETGSAPCLSAK